MNLEDAAQLPCGCMGRLADAVILRLRQAEADDPLDDLRELAAQLPAAQAALVGEWIGRHGRTTTMETTTTKQPSPKVAYRARRLREMWDEEPEVTIRDLAERIGCTERQARWALIQYGGVAIGDARARLKKGGRL